ncbi:hypothetical protein RxyAA322_25690 [Rubrobacter xylanophilus]|uniref:Asp23/Gls24 family envelope stress response protein n=1 Tax=Rubrobacter xylanophilus TaxID=49319 RepID=A0A510HMY6_9ACTN|nr:hypothetical protein [Rubrobacter xylanophilus]BBL80715.1 hypothetical protein RxyAA322_25690 [Rubrobacter xylanophilus]
MAGELLQLARAASRAALAVEGVADLGSGRFAEAATYEGGEKVTGVVVKDGAVEVHVILSYPLSKSVPQIAAEIAEKVSSETGRRATVVVEDLEVEGDAGL